MGYRKDFKMNKKWFYKKHWLSGKTVFDWEKVAFLFVAAFCVAFITFMVIEFPEALKALGATLTISAQSERKCLDAGYSEYRWAAGQYYCYRLVNGTEEVVPIERVE